MEDNECKHAGVDEEHHKDRPEEPDKLAQLPRKQARPMNIMSALDIKIFIDKYLIIYVKCIVFNQYLSPNLGLMLEHLSTESSTTIMSKTMSSGPPYPTPMVFRR